MDRNGPKQTHYKGENIISKQIVRNIHKIVLIFSAFTYFLVLYRKNILFNISTYYCKKKKEVKFLARQLGLGSAWSFIPHCFEDRVA